MFEREARLYDFQLGYLRTLVEGIDDDRLGVEPAPGVKPPAWVLGHLAIANDYALKLLGRPNVCPESWHRDFGPGSTPLQGEGPPPSKAELVSKYEEGHRAVREALASADPEAMARPHDVPMAVLRRALPTTADLLAHLLTTHSAYHLGQLSTWRRAVGFPAMF